MKGFKVNFQLCSNYKISIKNVLLFKTKIDLYCLKHFEKCKINLEKNCVNMAEALSDFREN